MHLSNEQHQLNEVYLSMLSEICKAKDGFYNRMPNTISWIILRALFKSNYEAIKFSTSKCFSEKLFISLKVSLKKRSHSERRQVVVVFSSSLLKSMLNQDFHSVIRNKFLLAVPLSKPKAPPANFNSHYNHSLRATAALLTRYCFLTKERSQ